MRFDDENFNKQEPGKTPPARNRRASQEMPLRAQPQERSEGKRIPERERKGGRRLTLPALIIVDLVLILAIVGVYMLFHLVIEKKVDADSGQMLVQLTPTPTDTEVNPSPSPTSGTAEADTSGSFGARWADKFSTSETPEMTENSYVSKNINLKLEKHQESGLTYFVVDIYVRDISNFKTAFSNGAYGGKAKHATEIGKDNNAIVAISGDYYANQVGAIVRNGEAFRTSERAKGDVLVMKTDGSMQSYTKSSYDFSKIKNDGIYQIWCFGPSLLDEEGKSKETFDSSLNPANPRSVIGYYEPGHYCFVMVDGRQGDYSKGLTLQQTSKLMEELGCKVAYNLDGGASAELAWQGTLINKPCSGGRTISDILMIVE